MLKNTRTIVVFFFALWSCSDENTMGISETENTGEYSSFETTSGKGTTVPTLSTAGDEDTAGDGDGASSTGDGDGGSETECNDRMFADYTACVTLADTSASIAWAEECTSNCSNAGLQYCALLECITGCSNDVPKDGDILACELKYPLCVYAVMPEDEVNCYRECSQARESCYGSPICTAVGPNEGQLICFSVFNTCNESCAETQEPVSVTEALSDGVCELSEGYAFQYCVSAAFSLSQCISACPASTSCLENESCTDGCYGHYFQGTGAPLCEAKYPDCELLPGMAPCQGACYIASQTCIETTCDISTCTLEKTICISSC